MYFGTVIGTLLSHIKEVLLYCGLMSPAIGMQSLTGFGWQPFVCST